MAAAADPQTMKAKLVADAESSQNDVTVISSSEQPAENGVHVNGEAVSSNGDQKRKSTGGTEEVEADSTPTKKPRLSESQTAEAEKPEADQQPEGEDSRDADESRDTDYNDDSKDVPSEEDGTAPPDPQDAEGEDSNAAGSTE